MARSDDGEYTQLEVEVDDADESDAVTPNMLPVSYFGTEFDVHGLVRRFNDGAIIVPSFDPSSELPDPNAQGFQRGRVWRKSQMDKFIESLLLGFPVPGIFLVEQPGKKYLVLDGQQRLTTLVAFYAGKFRLEGVEDALKGATYNTLADDMRRALDDTFIQAIIIRAPQTVDEYESVYQIFERLNSGGTNLQPHEIRVALYGGKAVELVRKLNNDENWRLLYGKRSERLKDQELILRVIALWKSSDHYAAPLKSFLNDFLGEHRDARNLAVEELNATFRRSAELIAHAMGRRAFRLGTQVNAAILDSVFVGVMDALEKQAHNLTVERLRAQYESLLTDAEYIDAVTKATANEDSVQTRLRLAKQAFG